MSKKEKRLDVRLSGEDKDFLLLPNLFIILLVNKRAGILSSVNQCIT